jgi:biotin carboxyl carrier protein
MNLRILVNGRSVEVDPADLKEVSQVEPGVYSVLLEGRSFEVRAVTAGQCLNLEMEGRRFAAEVYDPRDRGQKSTATLGTGRQNIRAHMPGKVIRVLVREGDSVELGQGLVVVEAMKMQNEMKAVRGGHVMEVRVHDGDTVSAGDTLVVLS